VRAAELARHVPEAAPALLALLDPARGPLQPPIRSEIFGPQRFAQHGLSLGLTHRSASVARRWQAGFSPRLRDNIAMLREAQRYVGAQAEMGVDLSPAAEWLLDNFHLIDAQLKEVHEGLPRSYFRTLPLLPDEPLAGLDLASARYLAAAIAEAAQQPNRVIVVAHDAPLADVPWAAQLALPNAA